MHLLVPDVPPVDATDATWVALRSARPVAYSRRDLLVCLDGGVGALGVAVCGERGEREEEGCGEGCEFHCGCMRGVRRMRMES